MAARVPRTTEAFAKISGVGTVKLERFSGLFLAAISEYAEDNGLEYTEITTQPVDRPRERNRGSRRASSTLNETKELIARKMSIGEVAKHRNLAETTVRGHLEQLMMSGEELDIAYLMPSFDRAELIRSAFQQTEDYRLAPVRELLGEEFSYEELALVRIGMRMEGA